MSVKTWEHDELANDLAASLVTPSRMIWTNLQLGPRGSPRPDVYTIEKSFVRPLPTAYECKISVSDFRSDVTSGKWSSYLNYAYRVIFAAPAGLVGKADVPEQCGLILRHENAWRLAKKPVVNPRLIAEEAWLKLLIDGVERQGPMCRAKRWREETSNFSKKFGATAARYVADATAIHAELERAEEKRLKIHKDAMAEATRIREKSAQDAPQSWRDLTGVLGLEVTAGIWDVRLAIQNLKREKAGGAAAMALDTVLSQLRRIIKNNEPECGSYAGEMPGKPKNDGDFISP